MQAIRERESITAAEFAGDVLPAGEPVVFRGFVRDWPIVAAAERSEADFLSYVRHFDRGYDIDTAYGAPSIRGRLFYNEDLSGLNFRMGQSRLAASLDYLAAHRDDDPAPTLAIQSTVIERYLPGLERENRLPPGFVPQGAAPRLWLGGRATVAAHFDPSENIACCVAGRRRFTLLPPGQVDNLYVGPFELTPAGATISMVDFDAPDPERFPKFAAAAAAACTADLGPGDAIYIPYLWWHHVKSLEPVNALINYWWDRAAKPGGDPRNALVHAMLCLRNLPASYRAAWRSLFEYYVFGDPEAARAHLPDDREGLLGELTDDDIQRMRQALGRALGRQ